MKNLRGSTLQELLVVMIITGILFLSVMEGVALVKRYALRTITGMEQNVDTLLLYYKHNAYTLSCDTVITLDTNYIRYGTKPSEKRDVLLPTALPAYGRP